MVKMKINCVNGAIYFRLLSLLTIDFDCNAIGFAALCNEK